MFAQYLLLNTKQNKTNTIEPKPNVIDIVYYKS